VRLIGAARFMVSHCTPVEDGVNYLPIVQSWRISQTNRGVAPFARKTKAKR
jgi:hypothetical protein